MPLIELSNITKRYGSDQIAVTALDDVSLQVEAGEFMAILGPSGSGKSTLMNILGCLDRPSVGSYHIEGQDVSQMSRNQLAKIRNQRIGFIFQSFNLLEYATALDNVALPLIYGGVKRRERIARAKKLLERVGLGDRMHHKPNQLSGVRNSASPSPAPWSITHT
nr:ABC transporter ATP-binding protein [Dongshaea marina]